jgi:hypothetical protein
MTAGGSSTSTTAVANKVARAEVAVVILKILVEHRLDEDFSF